MRGRSGAFVAEPLQESCAKASIAQEQLREKLRILVQEHKALGGSAQTFLSEAETQVAQVYGDPGIAGAKRNVSVLGLDEKGEMLKQERSSSGSLSGVSRLSDKFHSQEG